MVREEHGTRLPRVALRCKTISKALIERATGPGLDPETAPLFSHTWDPRGSRRCGARADAGTRLLRRRSAAARRCLGASAVRTGALQVCGPDCSTSPSQAQRRRGRQNLKLVTRSFHCLKRHCHEKRCPRKIQRQMERQTIGTRLPFLRLKRSSG